MVNYQNIADLIHVGRRKLALPSYLKHAATGQARTVWDGKTIYLGKYGSPESLAKHNQICAEVLATGHIRTEVASIGIEELIAKFIADMDIEYTKRDSREAKQMRRPLRTLVELFPGMPAADLSPLKLVAAQRKWIDKPMSKSTVNMYTGYVLRLYEWATKFEYVPESVWTALQSVGRIKERHALKRTKKVKQVDWERVEAIRPHIAPILWDVIQVQWHTGMRAEEVLKMTPGMIDQSTWAYIMTEHKTDEHVKEKFVFLGPRAREVIAPYLVNRPADKPLFSPKEAQAARYQVMREARKTKVQPSQLSRSKPSPLRTPGDEYQNTSYFRAIRTACERAGIEPWSSHQLRHTKGTGVRKQFGLEGAQVVLGHKSIKTTEIYAETDMDLAKRIAEELG